MSAFGQFCASSAIVMGIACILFATVFRSNARIIKIVALLQTGLIVVAYSTLAHAFLSNDFSWAYVAQHSSRSLPAPYRFAAVWSGHEGALLLWSILLAIWTAVFAVQDQRLWGVRRLSLALLCGMNSAWLLMNLAWANPFVVEHSTANDGSMNPLLQDPAMGLHPTLLYAGQTALAIPFVILFSAAKRSSGYRGILTVAHHWNAVAWSTLTLGLATGSWWAYHEHGWDGWYAWDAVQNLALLTWLFATASLHVSALATRTGRFSRPATGMAAVACASALLSSLAGRSGALNSVHNFASEAIGVYPSIAIAMIPMIAFVIQQLLQSSSAGNAVLHRGFAVPMFAGTLTMLLCGAVITFGTLYPPVLHLLTGENAFVDTRFYARVLRLPAVVCLLLLGFTLLWSKWNRANAAMLLSHIGILAVTAGAVVTSILGHEEQRALRTGELTKLGGHEIALESVRTDSGPNYYSHIASFALLRNHGNRIYLHPERRIFEGSTSAVSESAVHRTVSEDITITLGDQLGADSWIVSFRSRPLVTAIWFGAGLMVLGGLLCVFKGTADRL